jgi:5'-methylthioadenosine phosphorylase
VRNAAELASPVKTAIIAGSGFYELAGLEDVREVRCDTPFGAPSDKIVIGRLAASCVAFIARHGAGHRFLPSEINHRANIFALKTLGVERILSASAVGSMRETIRPRDIVVVDQFIDRTARRPATFFGGGIAAHVTFGDPVCPEIHAALLRAAQAETARVHASGTYVCIEGPAFSSRAESRLYRSWGVDVIGMTNLPEAKLAREAEICYATLALVTDYDCWHDGEEDVSVAGVLDNLRANQQVAARVLRDAVHALPERGAGCGCGEALRDAVITSRDSIPRETRERLRPLLGRYLERSS